MTKYNQPWLYAILITAILVLTQAVFLLLPTIEVDAESIGIYAASNP